MSLSTEVYWMLRERRGCCFVNLADEIKSIDPLERLLELSPDKIKDISKVSDQGKELSREIKKIQRECKTKGGVWLTDTESPPHVRDGLVYKHWLPVDHLTDQSRLLGRTKDDIENSWEKILEEEYQEFDTVCHVTHIDTAASIFKENNLQSHVVRDNSVFSKVPEHPNKDTEVIWFGPASKANLGTIDSKYGGVAFFMDDLEGYEGIRRNSGGWNYYFVEVIEYRLQSACRILVTTDTYPHLRPYDPTTKGGPWYYDKNEDKHYWLRDIVRWDGQRGKNGNSLEIMRTKDSNEYRLQWFKQNINFCPVGKHISCLGGRCGFKELTDVDFRLYIMYNAYKPEFKPFYMTDEAKALEGKLCTDMAHLELTTSSDSCDLELKNVLQVLLYFQTENMISMIAFWEDVKSWMEAKVKGKVQRKDLQAVCSTDVDLRRKVLSLMWKVAAETAARKPMSSCEEIIDVMKEFPYFEEEMADCLENF